MPSYKTNIFISFDIEGISAVSSWREVRKDSVDLARMRSIATADVNAAIRGARMRKRPVGSITICDAHASGENLVIENLEPGVTLIKGTPRKYYMMHGISKEYDVVFLIGYHAMAGTKAGGMDHTYSSASIYSVKINGRFVGETEINAALAGFYGVPVGLVSGDDRLIDEARLFLGGQVETVITKYGISRSAARCRQPRDVQKEIEAKATKAIQKLKKLKPFTFKSPIRAEIDLVSSGIADVVEMVPGIKRVNGRRFVFRAKDILEFYGILRLMCCLGMYANTVLV
ncbi:MAG: M55 family metallopeptidase [candidate division WOR-3 bacterium]|nr:MAG: M55 family metallopeptidase [candidate division WOR-3 bacterium]